MTSKEIRIACLQIVANGGVREPQRLVNDAKVLEAWVEAAEDKEQSPRARQPK